MRAVEWKRASPAPNAAPLRPFPFFPIWAAPCCAGRVFSGSGMPERLLAGSSLRAVHRPHTVQRTRSRLRNEPNLVHGVDPFVGIISHLLPGFPVPTATSPRIFVVDDEKMISLTAAAILRRSGFDATAFTNPLESLAAAFSGQPDLLISDVMMPELSGIELAVQIRQVCPNCQI